MKNNNKYPELVVYYEHMNDEVTFNEQIEAAANDTYSRQLMLEIVDALQDEEMLHDLGTSLIKDMFTYYLAHKDEHK